MSQETRPPISTEAEEKSATTLELFFDLVFVFAITQVVSLIVHDLTWSGLFHAVIILGILWWGWTNWTWVTNLVSLVPRLRRIVVLLGMVGVFIMAHAVPNAFEGSGMWMAIPYVAVNSLSTALMYLGIRSSGANLEGFWRYTPLALAGGGLLIVGSVFDGSQQWFWLAALLVNITAAGLAGSAEWTLDAKHFAERHGLIMIIALGEAIIVVGTQLSDEVPSWEIASYLVVGLTLAMTLYWAYFDRAQEIWENSLRKAGSDTTGKFARDVYSFTHFPMIIGIVLSAVALEEAFLHPDEAFDSFVGAVFVIGIACFLLGIALASFQATRTILLERIVAVAAIAALVFGATNLAAQTTVVSVTVLLVASMVVEHLRHRPRPEHLPAVTR